jgi:hypothetical protein
MRRIFHSTLVLSLLVSSPLFVTGCRSTGGSSWSNMWAGRSATAANGLASTKPNSQLPPSPASSFANSPNGSNTSSGTVASNGYPSTGMSGPNLGAPPTSGNTNGYYTGPYSTSGTSKGNAVTAGAVATTGGNRTDGNSANTPVADTQTTVPKAGYGNYPAAPVSNTTSSPVAGHDHNHDHDHDHGDHSHGAPQPPNPNAWNGMTGNGMEGGFRPGTTARGRMPGSSGGNDVGGFARPTSDPAREAADGYNAAPAAPPVLPAPPGGSFEPPQQ